MLFCRVWYPAGLCFMGSDTPQNFVKRGITIRPCMMLFSGVSDLADQVSAIKYTQLCHCSAGFDTPQDLVLWGLIPRRILFCGLWDPAGRLRLRRTRQKRFEILSFSLKGHFENRLHALTKHPRHVWFMLKEPPLSEKQFFVPRGRIPRRTTFKFEYLR